MEFMNSISLYESLLGEQWDAVSPKVKGGHLSRDSPGGRKLHANCLLDVVGSSNVIGRIISRIVGLPAHGKASSVALHVGESPEGEIWERIFPDCNLCSVQSKSSDGLLVDRFGMIAFHFRLEESDGGIIHHHLKTYLRLGSSGIRLPKCISPRVISHEEPDAVEQASRINVTLSMPLVGHLLSYRGVVMPVREGS